MIRVVPSKRQLKFSCHQFDLLESLRLALTNDRSDFHSSANVLDSDPNFASMNPVREPELVECLLLRFHLNSLANPKAAKERKENG